MVGNSVRVPGADAKPEDVAAFHKALGVPDTPDKYDVKMPTLPEGLGLTFSQEDLTDFLTNVAHKHGAPPALVQAAIEWDTQRQIRLADALTRQRAEAYKTAEAALRQEWGGAFSRNVGLARSAVRVMFSDDPALGQAIEQAGNNPNLVRGLVRIGEMLQEQGEIRGDEVPGGRTETEIQAAIDQIKARPTAEHDPRAADEILALTRELLTVRGRAGRR
jgi:hypothetical protein